MSSQVPISDVVINAVPPPTSTVTTPGNKRKLDEIGTTEGMTMEPVKQTPRSATSTSVPHINPAELHSVPLNHDNAPILTGMAPSTSTTSTSGDAVINITDDGLEGEQVEGEQTTSSSISEKVLSGFDRVLDAAQYPVDRIKDVGVYVGEGVVKVAEEVRDIMKDGFNAAKDGASVVGDALSEVAVQTNLAVKENFGNALAAGEFAAHQAEQKLEHLAEVVTGHAAPKVDTTTTSAETANLDHTNTTLVPDQGINSAPATTVKPGLSTSSTFSQQHADAASQWHEESSKHQNVV